ncbi:uncharacterized protein C6orf136 homolog [Brienomyrus brachyistius]|uniref:uncharacterized protein C6orf136 homolog n=1 Tax=Brienomyrus brachyistius TaxID=42636 RepID=UPI0020B392B7|nr:uncharacterized protein C6orf136 homolog [Brienomyrus brachyistius]XP_048848547.1 uncharacterized protein C6orf136 homolog [Brienomyrus brachyistius]XP_048848548.1 uncharacterized protein C6orf136 homolog [Brienomyrus brachyistius]
MALCRGGIAFRVGCGRSHGCRQPIKRQCWSLKQALDLQFNGPSRPISNICLALAPSSCSRRGQAGRLAFEPPLVRRSPAGRPTRMLILEEDWEKAVSLCVLLGPGDFQGQRTVVAIPVLAPSQLGELLALGSGKRGGIFLPLTTVDGTREDDINVRGEVSDKEEAGRESFRSSFRTESCPAPFVRGSPFYCFHGSFTEPLFSYEDKSSLGIGLQVQASGLSLSPPAAHYNDLENGGREGKSDQREREQEEKLALMYEALRIELPSFFMKRHNYGLYSEDVEFINGLLRMKTRGRLVYQLTLTLWQLLCRLYMADVRLEVLKLTKHSEDGTVRARWRLRGQPYHLMLLYFYRRDKAPLYRSYDAFSTFYVGPDGLIHRHRVDKVMQVQPPVLPRITSLLTGALVALGVQEHRPALNLLPFLLSSLRLGRQ